MKCTIILLIIFAFLLTACGSSTPTQDATSTSSPTAVAGTSASPQASAQAVATATTVPATASGLVAGPPPPPPTTNAAAGVPVLSALQGGATPLKQLWNSGLGETTPGEIVGEADGLLFVKTVGGSLVALNLKDGSVAWKLGGPGPLPTPTANPTPTPAPSATPLPPDPLPEPRAPFGAAITGTVMLGDPAVQNLRGYDTKTGQKKWETSLKFDAPNRDPGARYLPGALYEDTVVVAVSTKVNPFVQQPGPNPEYIRLLGIEIATGKIKWDFITEPAQAGADFRQGGVVYGTKTIVIEGPNLSTYAIDGKTGAPLWKAFGVYLIPSSEPDSLYRLAPQSQNQAHTPIVQKLDINNGGKLLWTRGLPITVNNDPPIAVSPDEKTAYASVFTVSQQGQKSYLWTFTESGQIRQIETTAYGFYSMLPTNEGVYLIQSSPQASGIVYFDLTKDTPAWAVGGALELVFGPQLSPEDSFYTVFGDEKNNGYLFNINKKTGQVISTNAIEMPTAPLYFSPSQKVVYAVSGTTKPTVYAYARP